MINPKPGLVKAVLSNLRREFPDEIRWVIHPKASLKGNHRVDLVMDEIKGNYRNRSVIRVVHNPQVSSLDVRGVNEAAKKMSGRYVKIVNKIIFTVPGTETSNVPSDFSLRQVPGFSFSDNEVVRNETWKNISPGSNI